MPEHFLPLRNYIVMRFLLPDVNLINLKLTLIPSIILKLQAQRAFLPKYMNPQSYKSQYMALP